MVSFCFRQKTAQKVDIFEKFSPVGWPALIQYLNVHSSGWIKMKYLEFEAGIFVACSRDGKSPISP
jgi:hypothetical protein